MDHVPGGAGDRLERPRQPPLALLGTNMPGANNIAMFGPSQVR